MNTLDGFEKFTLGPLPSRRRIEEPRVTLNNKGIIYLNAFIYDRIGRPEHVTLWYSRRDHAIAIQPTFPPTHETFVFYKKERGFAVSAAVFCQTCKIGFPTTVRFTAPEVNEGILVLRLGDTVPIKSERATGN
jgi:hypothetical protein